MTNVKSHTDARTGFIGNKISLCISEQINAIWTVASAQSWWNAIQLLRPLSLPYLQVLMFVMRLAA